jgi:hypothetical protein
MDFGPPGLYFTGRSARHADKACAAESNAFGSAEKKAGLVHHRGAFDEKAYDRVVFFFMS